MAVVAMVVVREAAMVGLAAMAVRMAVRRACNKCGSRFVLRIAGG